MSGSGGADERAQTTFTYDSNGMTLSRTEAVGRPSSEQRSTTSTTTPLKHTGRGGPAWPSFVASMEASVEKQQANWVAGTPPRAPETTLYKRPHCSPDVHQPIISTRDRMHDNNACFDATSHPGQQKMKRQEQVKSSATSSNITADRSSGRLQRVATPGLRLAWTCHQRSSRVRDSQEVVDRSHSTSTAYTSRRVECAAYLQARDQVPTTTSCRGDTSTTANSSFDLLLLSRTDSSHLDSATVSRTPSADASGNQYERLHLRLNAIGDGRTSEQAQSCNSPSPACGTWTMQRSETFAYDSHNRLSIATHPSDGTQSITCTTPGETSLALRTNDTRRRTPRMLTTSSTGSRRPPRSRF